MTTSPRSASNILADRLQRLVRGGLLTRDDAGRGRKATYRLTQAAIELVPVFAALGTWGVRHRPTSPELAERAQRLAEGGPKAWARFMEELRQAHLPADAYGASLEEV
jgi:DNA-binding HxlR family transcriptional regulator